MQGPIFVKFFRWVIFVFIIGCFSFFSLKLVLAINNSTAKDNEKRILLEAAHGSGYMPNGNDECNHASNTIDGITYYENLESRIMINKIAGYLKTANIPYEISNEIVGDEYFANSSWQRNDCNPIGDKCCGFRQGTIGNYSPLLYSHIDSVGADKYLFALELHFNDYQENNIPNESVVLVKDVKEPFTTNGKKITDAVDKIIGTSGSKVANDYQYLNTNLETFNNLYVKRNIPVYYLETFSMNNNKQLEKYLSKKEELAKEIAQALIEISGNEINLDAEEDEFTVGRKSDPFKNYSLIVNNNDFNCKAILVDINTGELNNLGKLLQDIFTIIKIMGPVLAICLSIIDFIKALSSNEPSKEQKNALKRTVIRLVIAIILLFLPYLLDLLFHSFGLYDISRCGIE